MERRIHRKGSPPWHAGSHHRSQERRKRPKRPDSRGSQRICYRIPGKEQRERLDKQASRYRTEHLRRLWRNPVQDDRRERTHRRLHLTDGDEVESFWDEEMEAREAVKEIIEKEVWNQIENSKESTAKEVMRKAHYLVDKGIIDPTNMIGDYVSTQLSLGEGLKAGAVGCIVDKEGNVYATLAFAPGGTVGVPLMTGYGFLSDKSDGYINSISGLSGSFSAIGGFGGTVGVSGASIIGEINASGSVGVSLSFAYTWYVGNIYQ